MESWSFPPDYDPAYMPDPKSRYWFPVRETMDSGDREAAILERIKAVMAYAYENAPFYRKKWDEAGVHPDHVNSLEDFERVPVVTKAELRQSQAENEPFGDYLCVPESEVHHIHGTSGTTGRPTAFAIGRGDWQAIANNQARVMWGMGLRPGDVIFIGSLFSLYMGSWGTMIGAERLRAKCFPFGAGATGMTGRAAMWMQLTKPKAFYGTPSYALHLAETAQAEGIEPKDFGLDLLFFSGEPGASIPSIKGRIENLYDAQVIDTGSMAEMTPWMNCAGSKETDGMLLWQDFVYTEVCDPKSFARVGWGEQGTPVYTHLERTSQPMIRLLSGDLTHWTDGADNPCGRTYPRLPDGIYGRIDDMFTIRGENIYPSAIDGVLNELPGYGGEHRIIITREGAMDELLVRMDALEDVYARGDEALSELRGRAEKNLGVVLGVRARVEVAPAGEIPRTDFKARRVIDDRDLFKSLIGGGGERGVENMSAQKTTKKKKKTAKKMAKKTAGKDTPGMDLIDGVLNGNVRAIARMISLAEAAKPENREALAQVFRHAGNAHVVGMTGVPGSGKSTLVRVLVQAVRATGRRVGVVAIDPSSPFSGGAILGDRVRMAELTVDDGVFIRSMATRGALGGLARSSLEAVDVLDAAGFDMVLIETVGVGQDEVDVVQAAHTVVVVSAPGLGDEIQAIKAGILEIADIHVVSKCDRPDSNATITDLKGMLTLGIRTSGPHDGDWEVSVVPTSAETGNGIDDLLTAIDAHGRHLKDSGGLDRRRREILEMRVLKTAEDIIRKDFRGKRDKLAPLMKDVEERNMDPHEAAVRLLATFNGKPGNGKPEKPGK